MEGGDREEEGAGEVSAESEVAEVAGGEEVVEEECSDGLLVFAVGGQACTSRPACDGRGRGGRSHTSRPKASPPGAGSAEKRRLVTRRGDAMTAIPKASSMEAEIGEAGF